MQDRIDWRAGRQRAGEFGSYVWRRFKDDSCLRMAASLSYTSLLAVVPLTAIAFAMLTVFPVFNNVREEIQDIVFSNMLPDSADAIRDHFNGFIVNATKLTAVGIAGLAVTAVLLLGTIESSMNVIFRVKKPPPMAIRLLVFWTLITVGPLLLGVSMSLSTYFFTLTASVGLDAVKGWLAAATTVLPTVIMIVLLGIFYLVVPNRTVGWRNALIGGTLAGVLFSLLRVVFGYYVTYFPTYQAVYGAVSVLPIFLVYMYLSWAVVLLGAVLTASLVEWRSAGGPPVVGALAPGERLALAVEIIAILYQRSRSGGRLTRLQLLRHTSVGDDGLEQVLERLDRCGWISSTQHHEWVLSRDIAVATLFDLYRDLGLVLRDEDVAVAGDGWRRLLSERLAEVRRLDEGALAVPMRNLLIDPAPADQARPERASGLRQV